MRKFNNPATPYVRQCVNLWLAQTTMHEFTVSEVSSGIEDKHEALEGVDLSKSVSNELVRHETLGLLISRKGVKGVDGCGTGRPPRVYRKRNL